LLLYTLELYPIILSDSNEPFNDVANWSFDEETLRLLDEPPDSDWDAAYQKRLFDAAKVWTNWSFILGNSNCVMPHQGRDVFICAVTGYGKTAPCVMPCLIEPELLIWLISPLNALGTQHVDNFRKWGIKAISVNATTGCQGPYKVS
jgi:hypothetical protein